MSTHEKKISVNVMDKQNVQKHLPHVSNSSNFYQKCGHKCYQPLQPTCSRLLQQRWDSANYTSHRQRVLSAKPVVNTSPTPPYLHVQVNFKKLQMEIDRRNEILKHNEILLNRMSSAIHKERRLPVMIENPIKTSCFLKKRGKEMEKIMGENFTIFNRIMSKISYYDAKKLQKDYDQSRQFLQKISAYSS